jgi:hypothetical protein
MPVANQWTRIEKIIPGETVSSWNIDNTLGLALNITLAAGTNWQTGDVNRWTNSSRAPSGYGYIAATGMTNFMATVNGQFYLTGVQMEKGTIATGFERRPLSIELGLCQRYYAKSAASDVLPNLINSLPGVFGTMWIYSTSDFATNVVAFPVEIRVSSYTFGTNLFIYPVHAGGSVGQIGVYQGSWLNRSVVVNQINSKYFYLAAATGQTLTIGSSYSAFNYVINVEL